MSRFPIVPTILAGLLLAGCATVVPVPTTVEMPGMPNPEAALQQSIHHVDAEMAELGEMSPTMTRVAEPIVPEDLQRTVSFSWNGPLDAGVAKLDEVAQHRIDGADIEATARIGGDQRVRRDDGRELAMGDGFREARGRQSDGLSAICPRRAE